MMFQYGIPELMLENATVIDQLVEGIYEYDPEMAKEDHDALTPEMFIKCTSFIVATTFEEKIDLFFKMIDKDENGFLSWDEIFVICRNSLAVFQTGEDTSFIDTLSRFFTDYIFQ